MIAETLSFPNLIAGGFPRQTGKVKIAAGADLSAGAILGKILYDGWDWTCSTRWGPNTVGSGSVSYAGVGPDVRPGTYVFECTAAAVDGGTFGVHDPDGRELANLTVGELYQSDHIKAVIEDGEIDWAVGDIITYTMSRSKGSGKFKLCDYTAYDGSEDPVAVLAEDAAAAAEDVEAVAFFTGCFNSGAVSLANGTSIADLKDALEARNIYLVEADNNVNV